MQIPGEDPRSLPAGFGLDAGYPVTAEQVRSLREDGWALLPGLISRELAGELLAALAGEPARGGFSSKESPNPNVSQEGMAWRHGLFREVATSARLCGAAVALMGEPTALLGQDVSFVKPGGSGATRLHQDFPYMPFDRWGEVSVWIALVDIDGPMGPLHYLRGSHREGPLGRNAGRDIRERYPRLAGLDVVGGQPLAAGDAQVHWDLTVHGAEANGTGRPRAAYVCRYMPADTIYTGVGYPHFDAFDLVPGRPFSDCKELPLVGPQGLVRS